LPHYATHPKQRLTYSNTLNLLFSSKKSCAATGEKAMKDSMVASASVIRGMADAVLWLFSGNYWRDCSTFW